MAAAAQTSAARTVSVTVLALLVARSLICTAFLSHTNHCRSRTEVQFCYGSRCVVAKVTDRGPYVEGRSFDLSYGAARKLGIVEDGVARVMARIIN